MDKVLTCQTCKTYKVKLNGLVEGKQGATIQHPAVYGDPHRIILVERESR